MILMIDILLLKFVRQHMYVYIYVYTNQLLWMISVLRLLETWNIILSVDLSRQHSFKSYFYGNDEVEKWETTVKKKKEKKKSLSGICLTEIFWQIFLDI